MEEKTPKISIVLPTYNGQEYIRESIESVLCQSYKDFELIIIDDCSIDNTNAIVSEYEEQDARVKVIRNEKNLKLPASLNRGFEHARGEYFTWTSDDNLYESTAIEKMCDCLENNQKVGLVYCDYSWIDENGIIIEEKKALEPDNLCTVNCVGACFLYRASIAQKIGGYDTNMFLSEDYDYWLRIYENSDILHLPMNLYRYRMHGGSLTATKQEQIRNQTAKLWMKHIEFLIKHVKTDDDLYFLCDTILKNAPDECKTQYYKTICKYSRRYQWKVYKRKIRKFIDKA